MAFFVSPASKLERAVRALIVLQGKGTWENSFISKDSGQRTLPNRTFIVGAFVPTRPYRPEGVCSLEIQHYFPGVQQQGQQAEQRIDFDAFLGDTIDTLNLAGNNQTDMGALADAITAAGRWLATPDANPADATAATLSTAIVAANGDMANFRCDWVKFGTPFLTRGNDTDTLNWVEIIHLSAFVSHSAT